MRNCDNWSPSSAATLKPECLWGVGSESSLSTSRFSLGVSMVKRLPRAWSGHSQCLELRAHILVEKKLSVNVTTHHNRAIPDSRVYLSYGVTLVSPVNQKLLNTKLGNRTWTFCRQRLISLFHGVPQDQVSLQVANLPLQTCYPFL